MQWRGPQDEVPLIGDGSIFKYCDPDAQSLALPSFDLRLYQRYDATDRNSENHVPLPNSLMILLSSRTRAASRHASPSHAPRVLSPRQTSTSDRQWAAAWSVARPRLGR